MAGFFAPGWRRRPGGAMDGVGSSPCGGETRTCRLGDRQLAHGEIAVLPGTGHIITSAKIERALDFLGRHLHAS